MHAAPTHRFRGGQSWLLTGLCLCCLLAGNPGFADQRSEALLLKIEQQISAGHFIWPQDDNALQTWQLFMKNASPAEPGTRQALAAFADHMHSRAIQEQTEGRPEISKALMSFDAMARAMLDSPAPPAETAAHDTSHTDAMSAAIASATPTAASAGKPEAPPPAAPHQPDAQQQALAAMYLARGNEKLAIRDISAARKIYEYAAGIGSAAAATALAKTYDPTWLAEIGAVGVRPDRALATAWYRKAAALGDPDAKVRLQALGAN